MEKSHGSFIPHFCCSLEEAVCEELASRTMDNKKTWIKFTRTGEQSF